MSKEKIIDNVAKILETIVLKIGGEEGKQLVKHNHLVEDVFNKLGVMLQDDFVDKLHNCTNDELEVINSRLTMIINTLNEKEVR